MVAPDESGAPPAQGPYAQKVRQTLLASKEIELLARTVEQLQRNRPNMEFCRSLIERVLSIEPETDRPTYSVHGSRYLPSSCALKRTPATSVTRIVWCYCSLSS